MDCHRCIHLRLEHWFRTLDWTRRSRCFERHGHGPLGNSGMDDSDSGMGVRAVLFALNGVYHAGIPREALQQGEPHHSLGDLAHQLCAYQGGRNRVCGRTGVPAGVRHQGIVGHRLLLDCGHRTGADHGRVYHLRRYEVSALYVGIANAHPLAGLAHYPGAGTEGAGRMGRDDGHVLDSDR